MKLKAVGLDDKDDRRLVLAAIRKAGYVLKQKPSKDGSPRKTGDHITAISDPTNSPQLNAVQAVVRVSDLSPSWAGTNIYDRPLQRSVNVTT